MDIMRLPIPKHYDIPGISGKIMSPDNLTSLTRRAAQGDLAAQTVLCHAYENEVRIVARVHLGTQLRPHLDSVDVTQSVHRSILSGLIAGRFLIDNSRGLVALACLIARRKIAKQWRKHRRQLRPDPSGELNLQELIDHADTAPQARSEMACEELSRIRDSVTPLERLLIDRKLAGMTSNQIAEELNIDPVAVRVRWSRLSAKLRKHGPSAPAD